MEVEEIFKIIFGVTASIGAIGAFILFVIKLSAEKIAEALQKKYTLKFDKELEKYKTKLDNKTYISKTKFDAEFSIYRELSKAFSDLVRDVSILIPRGLVNVPYDPEDKKEYDNKIYNNAVSSYINAQNVLNGNTPFIDNSFYEKYSELLKMCSWQCDTFQERWNVSFPGTYEEKSHLKREDYQKTKEINEKFKELNNLIREYLNQLDVLDW